MSELSPPPNSPEGKVYYGPIAAMSQREAAETAMGIVLSHLIGVENASDPGIRDTPKRFYKALLEMTEGYNQDPKEILEKEFDLEYPDEVIILKDIPFTSVCEHHLLPFYGIADVAYIPGDRNKVVGLSKLARLVDFFAKRLQMQERITRQVAEALSEHLKAKGAAVVLEAEHSCMACRGVKKAGAKMVTSCMLGVFRHDAMARSEFLTLCRR
jgi:GTP cyclohydrolase I